MIRHQPNRLLVSRMSDDILREDTRNPRRPMNPLAGIRATHRTIYGYREASPDGDGVLLVLDGSCSVHSHPTANYSLLTSNSSYTFSAKEKDSETGLSYFGSRYYSSDLSVWLSVDPMSDKYPSLSPYTYCANNPVRVVDPDGEEIVEDKPPGKISNFLTNLDRKVVGTSENRQFEGGSDGANQGTMTKQDVEVGVAVVATMVTCGAAAEAEGLGSAIVSVVSVTNNIDDATIDTKGQTFSQRKTENNPKANNAVNLVKTASPAASAGYSTMTIVKKGVKKAATCVADMTLSAYGFMKSLITKKKTNVKS